MDCPICAHQNKPDARFCVYCGAELDNKASTLQSGQLVDSGTYRIIRPLGKGGMGAVYLAANTKAFDRQCVIKEVIEYYDPTDPLEREKALRRFETEARTLASLKHPGIPDIYAYFSENGRNYLVMEYIEGPNLSAGLTREEDGKTVKGHPKPVDDVVQYAVEICEVLDYLEKHQPPVMHNDIKPANIILDKNGGQAVLVDFGTARTRYARQAAGQPGRQQSSVYGTVGYAPPELYDGKAEPRSDVYSLAATAYHLLTDDDPRNHPFQFPEMDTIPMPLRQVLGEALSNEVGERPSAAQFGQRLRGVLQPQTSSAVLVQPLTFPNGARATTREELTSLCVRNWDYARDILHDGSIVHWLRDALHDAVAARTAEEAVLKFKEDSDAALEYLIRTLDPKAMPAPQLDVISGRLRYEGAVGRDASQSIVVANNGGGFMHATVTSSVPWVKVQARVRCAPGQRQEVPVAIDTSDLTPGHVYQAKVEIQTPDAQSASIPVEVRVPPPVIHVTPMQIDLGTVSRRQLFTDRTSFDIQNTGSSRAICQVGGNPPWLFLDPVQFTCHPGQTRTVELVGRVDLLPAEGTKHRATLFINIEGRNARQVEITVKTQTGKGPRGRVGAVVAIGFATLILLGAIIWFVLRILPLLVL